MFMSVMLTGPRDQMAQFLRDAAQSVEQGQAHHQTIYDTNGDVREITLDPHGDEPELEIELMTRKGGNG